MTAPRTLFIDIETTPNLAHVWGLWQQNVGLNQLLESSEILCFAAKWRGTKKMMFHSDPDTMIERAYELLDEADAVVHYNGRSFDIPHLNREFLLRGFTPPAPYIQVDLLDTVKRQFRFPSNKLAYVAEALELGGKEPHHGHELWIECMAGDRKAWAKMRKYNEQDVRLLEDLYDTLLPWITNHPTFGLYDQTSSLSACPTCGSSNLERRGFYYTKVSVYQRYHCKDCGKWSRASKRSRAQQVQPTAAS